MKQPTPIPWSYCVTAAITMIAMAAVIGCASGSQVAPDLSHNGFGGDSSGTGGTGGATAVCTPGETRECYTGPPNTAGIGACQVGTETCDPSGTAWGHCEGEVIPTAEVCATPTDDNCDGDIADEDAGCICIPGEVRDCYTGPAGTAGIGTCQSGTETCDPSGTAWGHCEGEIIPTAEVCATPTDDDCDGDIADEDAGCVCIPGEVRDCYTGPAGTAGIGTCQVGTETCDPTGTAWGSCVGEILPSTEVCDGSDSNCNGQTGAQELGPECSQCLLFCPSGICIPEAGPCCCDPGPFICTVLYQCSQP